ncbi:MAG TPA: AI-2E family transporter [Tahibacter sp.]|uniref:AI-2E family transporter n=1 Tax=Tahibacter sp. TaxID=2056211 RepID=UPI002BF34FE4|nr:AI-2E family transporter [Tahibacter sp.]HSX59040.1 AI-2E family transporter [Tahibacter sp.]
MSADRPSATTDVHRLLRVLFVLALLYGCWRVLSPFVPALLFAIAIVVSLWPLHAHMLQRCGGRHSLASLASCLLIGIVVIAPVVVLIVSFDEAATAGAVWFDELVATVQQGPPRWLTGLPWIGERLGTLWTSVANGDGADNWLSQWVAPARGFLVGAARGLGNGLAQLLLGALLLFVLFRDGERLAQMLTRVVDTVGGRYAVDLLDVARRALVGVMLGVVGTASAQSLVAAAGFAIAGVPHPLLLGAFTFVLSLVPFGPPLVWGGAAFWLLHKGAVGWAIFMALYGFFGISTVDNVVKPLLISRSSDLSFVLTLIGVLGGIVAFGVVGVFIGPVLLAIVVAVVNDAARGAPPVAAPAPAAPAASPE